MNAPAAPPVFHVDVLIVGAGISGIGMAVHMSRELPHKSYAIVEARAAIGGTWDLFRYPGVRSDSDMHTFGYDFAPWTDDDTIAQGGAIRAYLERVADEHRVREHIAFNERVLSADWSTSDARWTIVTLSPEGERRTRTAGWLYLGSGYYDYDEGYDPPFPGSEDFDGTIVHPQFWPEKLDVAGKHVVVIGSGATAVTVVPALADQGADVVMLQRTPTWYFIGARQNRIANRLRGWLGEDRAYRVMRWWNIRLGQFVFNHARKRPDSFGRWLQKPVRRILGDQWDDAAYTPPYGPWEQRLCLVPDGDLFHAIRNGKARVETARIDRIEPEGVRLTDGRLLPADIIVTATGLKLVMAGKIDVRVDGEAIRWPERFYYKGCMFSGIPNLAAVFGYLNASWTLKADLVAHFVCRVIATMDDARATMAVPTSDTPITADEALFDFSSGYINRALDLVPKNGRDAPWRLNQDYLLDRRILLQDPIDDGVLRMSRARKLASTA